MTDTLMTDSLALPDPRPATALPSLAAARDREAAGDLQGADAIYAALYDQRAPDPAVLIAWSRLRRRVGDAQNAATMLDVARRAGGGVPVLIDLAAMLIDAGRGQEAGNILRQAAASGRSVALDFQVARFQAMNRQLPQAAALFRSVMKADPKHVEARIGLARTLVLMGQAAEAEAAYTALLKREPNSLPIMNELAYLHGSQRRFPQALALYDRMAEAGVDTVREHSQVALGMMHVADWSAREALTARLAARMQTGQPGVFETYALLAATDDPALHRRMAETFAGALAAATAALPRPAPRAIGPAERRLRIGYLCGDFNHHATGLLLAGVLEAHDREAFEIFAYDYSAEDGSPTRARLIAAFEHFVRMAELPPAESAARIAADEIDILIDLKGYTERSRTDIMALRPAPVQVSFLGYAGTQGAPWIDYVIADAIVLPPAQQPHWAEQAARMPFTYYPNDRGRPTPEPDTDRAAQGLPADGIVFACFNNPFKITPEVFCVWMELLAALPGSVVWLYEGNPFVAGNLRAACTRAGIDPARLVFAKPAALDAHVARHGCADLFLDTVPYGAHTTAADALWAGLPLVTCTGQSWASRVGASLLHAVGMPDLIAADLAGYKALALALAADPARRAALRARLVAARDTAPLFDAAGFARGLEKAYRHMAERHRAGEAPQAFDVASV
jgi:predicted O-linked N-acetylglucosamine transferase (SPINDLY family)